MSLAPGSKLGPYEVLAPIGAGGMGEVYRGRDTKLKRDVALKVLPSAFANDPERMARFQREAEVLASLNHPNIATIHGVEDRALVMELVEGDSPKPSAVRRGLEDRVTDRCRVGICARTRYRAPGPEAGKHQDHARGCGQATRLRAGEGVLESAGAIGKSRELAHAHSGCNGNWRHSGNCGLHGSRASSRGLFTGEDAAETLAAVIHKQPDLAKVPQQARRLLEECLQKDPKQRLRDIGDAKRLLAAGPPTEPTMATSPSRLRLGLAGWIAAGVSALAALVLAYLYFFPKPPAPPEVTRFEIPQPDVAFSNTLALSPDGRKLAYVANTSGALRLWIRSMDAIQARALAGTEGAAGPPFWSPDSKYIVFWAGGKLLKVEASGGPTQTLCTEATGITGGFWTREDKIVFGVNRTSGLLQVSAAGGETSPVTALANREVRHGFPSLLPDGRHFVYLAATNITVGSIVVASLDAKPNEPKKMLLRDASPVVFAPGANGGNGYLLFVRAGTLMAQPFDTRRLELAGDAVPLAEQVVFGISAAAFANGFAVSPMGTLVYRTGGGLGQQQMTWFDRQGKVLGAVGEPFVFNGASAPALSPDGKRVALTRSDPAQSGNPDIWLFEFARGVMTRFTFDPGADQNPIWSPDGSRIVFQAEPGGVRGIYQKSSNLVGGEELLYKSGGVGVAPISWSRDSKYLLYQTGAAGIFALPMEGSGERKPILVLPQEFGHTGARFSPDGKYIAYNSTESGRQEVYVRTFDASGTESSSGGKWLVSKDGGGGVHWRADGKELYYLAADRTMMAVDVTTTPVFQAGVPKPLFKSNAVQIQWDSTADGQRFLLPILVGANSAAPYTVVLNWTSLLRK